MADKRFIHEKNRKDAIKILKAVVETLDRYNIAYYLDFGTLIGAVREKGLIPWDDDIDISLLNESDYQKMPQVLKEIQRKYGLRTYLFTFETAKRKRQKRGKVIYTEKVSFTSMNHFQIAKVRNNKFWIFGRGNTCIDIFFKYEFKQKSWWMAYGKENSIPLEYMSPELEEISFCGLQCKIPKEYDRYLTYKYGDWKIPKENWSHEKDDYSIVT